MAIDRAGMALPECCGLPCIVTPLLGAAVGMNLGWLLEGSTEALPLTALIGTAAVSLGPSCWRRCRRKGCLGLFAAANRVNLRSCCQWVHCETGGPAA